MAEGHSTLVLRALCGDPLGPSTVLYLVNDTGLPRKKILNALGRLIAARLAQRIEIPRKFGPRHCQYSPTAKGIALILCGGRVAPGPKGPLNGQRKTRKETFRARLWTALRMKRKATVPELVEAARRGYEKNAANNAQGFMRQLARAGIVTVLPVRAKGFAPSSPGFGRYALARDLGPKCPLAGRKHLFDPNSGTKTPYREKLR